MLLSRKNYFVCQQVVELVTDYLEGSLSRIDRRRFDRHLKGCPNCTNYLEQMRITIATTGTLHVEDLSPEAEQDFTELFRRWSEDDGR
jgi:predicted anti-sigma-YlaC factor YlaD